MIRQQNTPEQKYVPVLGFMLQRLILVQVFFFKGHIFSGQARPDGKGATDFAWLTKEEIETKVEAKYWTAVKDMLSDS